MSCRLKGSGSQLFDRNSGENRFNHHWREIHRADYGDFSAL